MRCALVKNGDVGLHTSALSTTCSGTMTGCAISKTALTLQAAVSDTIYVTYTAGAAGTTGVVKLKADLDSGWVNVTSVGPPAPVVSVADANAGTAFDRSQCVTMAAGSAGAVECGDLRLVHPLPAIRTLNKVRMPTLLYNSAAADPRPVVVAYVTLASGQSLPDSVEGILRFGGVEKSRARWAGSDWTAGGTRQIALADTTANDTTKVVDYTFEVATIYGANRYPTVASGKLLIVSRRLSPLGAGWWLAGLERLEMVPDGSKLWVGGDGSARLYTAAGTNTWVAPALDRPDTLKWNTSQSRYLIVLPHGDTVKFNSTGDHVATVNRLNHATSFTYASGRLTTITLPSQGGSQAYKFVYDTVGNGPGNYRVTADTAPGGRVTKFNVTSSRLNWIRDVAGDTVKFTYESGARRIIKRTDRRGSVTAYSYDVIKKVSRMKVNLEPDSQPDSISVRFRAVERWGYRPNTDVSDRAARDTASAYGAYWGPRRYTPAATGDSLDQYVWFYPDRFGAPRKIKNVLNEWTYAWRHDAEFPALVTKTQAANGRTQGAAYDARGNLLTSTDTSTSIGGVYTTTRYVWDTKWDLPTRVVPPTNDSSVSAYDATTGNVLWRQDARGASSQVTFTYWSSGNKAGLLHYLDPRPAGGPKYVYDYDASRTNLSLDSTLLGFVTTRYTDALGRDTLVLSPIEPGKVQRVRTYYNVLDRVDSTRAIGPSMTYVLGTTQTVPAETLTVKQTYDKEGNITQVVRASRPDTNGIGGVITTYRYDRANRRVAEVQAWGARDSTAYDAAGNAKRLITARGDTIRMTYDALDRLTRRIVPAVSYAQTGCFEYGLATGCGYLFPIYPNSGTSYLIPVDTASFTYDNMGNLTSANNRYARIWRSYNANGTLATDTISLRGVAPDTTFGAYKYGMRVEYDGGLRRTKLYHPAPLGGSNAQEYTYNSFGALATVKNVQGNLYRFFYDLEARLDSTAFPGGWRKNIYDADGRTTESKEWLFNPTREWHHQRFTYDQRGRIDTVSVAGAPANWWSGTNAYSGLGSLAFANGTDASGYWFEDQYRQDALGSASWKKSRASPPPLEGYRPVFRYGYQYVDHRVLFVQPLDTLWTVPEGDWWYGDWTANHYDAAGNVDRSWWRQLTSNVVDQGQCSMSSSTLWHRRAGASYYAADGKLRAEQTNRDVFNCQSQMQHKAGIWEEYWYDALGRRVFKHSYADTQLCDASEHLQCIPGDERYVWDGDRLLYEIRTPDGSIGYTHGGGGVDAPLDLMAGGSGAIVLHSNWRGLFDSGSDTTGAQFSCAGGYVNGCTEVAWAGADQRAFLNRDGVPAEWWGSIVTGQRDQTGQIYMRNRYYDPASGQFTQQDPIGLAGGLNLYGFAHGDPINFSDPFGLCPPCSPEEQAQIFAGVGKRVAPLKKLEPVMLLVAGLATGGLEGGAVKGLGLASETGEAGAGLRVTGTKIGELLGKPFPTKIGAGGRLQPFNPANGQYLSPDVNPGLAASPLVHFGAGFGQGFVSTTTGVEAPVAVTKAQELGQTIGRLVGLLFH